MAKTNAEYQAKWREKRNKLAQQALDPGGELGALRAQVAKQAAIIAATEAENATLRKVASRPDPEVERRLEQQAETITAYQEQIAELRAEIVERDGYDDDDSYITKVKIDRDKEARLIEAVVAKFGDGEWHEVWDIANGAMPVHPYGYGVDSALVHAMHPMIARTEVREHGKTHQWRIYPIDRTVGMAELGAKLAPIAKGLKTEGKKNAATISIGTVAHLAGTLQNLIDEWSGK